jgi:hypothetical protein
MANSEQELIITGGTLQFDDDSYSYFVEVYVGEDMYLEFECQENFDSSKQAEKIAMECMEKLADVLRDSINKNEPKMFFDFCKEYQLAQTNVKEAVESASEFLDKFVGASIDEDPTIH